MPVPPQDEAMTQQSFPAEGPLYRVTWNLEGTRRHEVCDLNAARGPAVVLGNLERWQALAIVAVLEHPFGD